LPERTGGRVAWIGKGVVASFCYASIQRLEIIETHIDFTAYDKMVWEVGLGVQLQWQGTDRAKIDGHILSDRSIASGRPTGKDSMVVYEFNR
jgi:hypothetical protein